MPAESPIFVVGHPRSGTTLLRLILDAHPRIVIPPEGHLISLLRRAEKKFGDLKVDANMAALVDRLLGKERMVEWALDDERVRRDCMAGERTPGGVLSAFMRQWTERAGKPRWGEKTPGTYRFLPEVSRWFPDGQVLHIIRDGRDVAVSCLTPPFADAYDKGNVYEVAARWRDALRRGRRAAAFMGPARYREIRYEELTADPERVVRGVCEFLHEDFTPEMLRYHERREGKVARGEASFHKRLTGQVDNQQVERWRRDATEEFVLGFEGLAGAELVRYGYRLSGYAPTAELRARVLLERLRPRRARKNYKPPGGKSAAKGAAQAGARTGESAGGKPDGAPGVNAGGTPPGAAR